MSERGHIALLILVMALAVLLVSGVSGALLYRAASTQARQRLTRTAQSQALLAGAIARFDARHSAEYPGGWLEATLSQLRAAHDEFEAKLQDDIVALHEHLESRLGDEDRLAVAE